MPVQVIEEDGSGVADANSYVSVAYADTYAATSSTGAAWGELEAEAKGVLVIRATRTLDALCQFPGYPARPGQALRWPRTGVVVDGWTLDPAKLPTPLKQACSELAGFMAENDGEDVTADSATDALDKVTIGPIEIDFRAGASNQAPADKIRSMLPSSVYALLLPLLSPPPPLTVRLQRS